MILDTGSSISIINHSIVNNIPEVKIEPVRLPILRLANNSVMHPVGRILVDIRYYDKVHKVQLYIYNHLPFAILLGLDFCKTSKISINFEDISLPLNPVEELLLFCSDTSVSHDLKMTKDMILPKSTCTVIELYSESQLPVQIVFTANEAVKYKFPILIQDCITETQNNRVKLIVVNYANSYICLRKNMKVGSFQNFIESECLFRIEEDNTQVLSETANSANAV